MKVANQHRKCVYWSSQLIVLFNIIRKCRSSKFTNSQVISISYLLDYAMSTFRQCQKLRKRKWKHFKVTSISHNRKKNGLKDPNTKIYFPLSWAIYNIRIPCLWDLVYPLYSFHDTGGVEERDKFIHPKNMIQVSPVNYCFQHTYRDEHSIVSTLAVIITFVQFSHVNMLYIVVSCWARRALFRGWSRISS
jgi:hypothetical protein